jgi:hypothetical protein
MLVQSGRHEDGAPITLMSVDVDILSTTGEMLHETWAQMLEVIVGTGLLASQIGWLCLIPLVIVFCECPKHCIIFLLNLDETNNEKVALG